MSSKLITSQTREVTKIDLRKELKQLYNPPAKEVVLVEVPDMNFLIPLSMYYEIRSIIIVRDVCCQW